jgi:hypothetical protein
MATVMLMEWPGVIVDEYNRVMKELDLDAKTPAGGVFHVAGFTGNTLHVLDVWDSQQAFEKFQQDRLVAAVQKVGIKTQPNVQFYPVHNMYVPNIDVVRKAGASSLPG